MIYNVSKNKINYSQKNNNILWQNPNNKNYVINAWNTCNVTSMIMALQYNGWKFPKGKYQQPEDNLQLFILENKETNNFYKKNYPKLYKDWNNGKINSYQPIMIHKVLAFGVNTWLNDEVVTFNQQARIENIFNEIKNNSPVVLSGNFLYNKKIIGHINVLVGFEIIDKKIKNVIIDDPFGNVYKNFQNGITGNDVFMPYQDFIKCYKPLKDDKVKMQHFIKKAKF